MSANNLNSQAAWSQKSAPLHGEGKAPGDKSISHRALILGSIAEGTTTISGLLEGDDILATAAAVQSFGANIQRSDDGLWHIKGCGDTGWQSPENIIDCGNAGTGVRLIMGAAAGYNISARFTGDQSLKSRPMGRILTPLANMGVKAEAGPGTRLPITLHGDQAPHPIDYTPPQASAQVKSAVLLAGLNLDGETCLREPVLTRDHTENMLKAFGAVIKQTPKDKGQIVTLMGPQSLTATHINVPGDPSSAAFMIVAALIVPGSDIIIRNVMMNKTRTGLIETLTEMGGYIRTDNFRTSGGEIMADIHIKVSNLRAVHVPPERAASMIDEYPILSVAAAYAKGTTHMMGIGELRVKESDRIAATLTMLTKNGIKAEAGEDHMSVSGGSVTGGAVVTTHHDHRIAMSALILGLGAENPVYIDDADMIKTSFPNFFELMQTLNADIHIGAPNTTQPPEPAQ